MKSILFLSIAFLMFTISSTIFYLLGIDSFRPDLLTILCFIIIRTKKPFPALVTCIIVAMMFSSFHQANANRFIFQTLIFFSVMRLFVGRYLNLVHPLFIAVFLFCAEMVLQVLLWGTIGMLQTGNWIQTPEIFGSMLPIAFTTGLLANPIMFFFKWLFSLSPMSGNDDFYIIKRS